MINQNELQKIKDKYPIGSRVQMNKDMDDIQSIKTGEMGTIDYIDDEGQIHVRWDNGSGLALIEGVDDFCLISKELNHNEEVLEK